MAVAHLRFRTLQCWVLGSDGLLPVAVLLPVGLPIWLGRNVILSYFLAPVWLLQRHIFSNTLERLSWLHIKRGRRRLGSWLIELCKHKDLCSDPQCTPIHKTKTRTATRARVAACTCDPVDKDLGTDGSQAGLYRQWASHSGREPVSDLSQKVR